LSGIKITIEKNEAGRRKRGGEGEKREYEKRFNQKGCTIWIAGLHCSGKNELAYTLEKQHFELGAIVVMLEGKSVRSELSGELDFTQADRAEHLRRVAHIYKLLNDRELLRFVHLFHPPRISDHR